MYIGVEVSVVVVHRIQTNFPIYILLDICIQKYKTKQGLNNALVKRYDSKNGGKIYQAIKPLIKDKKEN